VLVVTVFAGTPDPSKPISPFARQLHARWGHPIDAAATRREEDLQALALLGAQAYHWPYTDCIYRQTSTGRFPYASEEALWGEVHPEEKGLIAELAARLATLSRNADGTAVYAPLGAGHHVDHQVVRQAAEASGHGVVCYEDFPYARDPQVVQAALVPGQEQSRLIPLCEDALKMKIAAIARYRSQISTFWTDEIDMVASVRAFANQTGEGKPAERYWSTPNPRSPVLSL
jgi:LmbE family N-acetylglucosaminyl deacetylase